MKTFLSILLSLLSFRVFADSTVGDPVTGTNQETKPYDSWTAHRILEEEQKQQDVFSAKLEEIQARIVSLQIQIGTESAAATNAHDAVDFSRSQFLLNETVTKDVWRDIYGEKRFVVSPNSGFVKFNGQILEVAANGIRVFGQIGDSPKIEYFVVNFPYDFKAGENVDPSKNYVALNDGEFSYVSEDGYAKTIPKLNYGKPCQKPGNGDAIEQAAKQSQLVPLERDAKAKDEMVSTATNHLQLANNEIIAVKNEAASELNDARMRALKYDQDYADKGEILALKRMGERYQKGDGVEVDLVKSAEFYKKAEDRSQAVWDKLDKESRRLQQEALKQKFLKNLDLADRMKSFECTLYVEKCYREGLGTEINLDKAKEYHDKAIAFGLPMEMNDMNRQPFVEKEK